MSKPKKPRATAVDFGPPEGTWAANKDKPLTAEQTVQALDGVLSRAPVTVEGFHESNEAFVDALKAATTIDLTPIHRAAEKAGLKTTALSVSEVGITVACGPHVPPFIGDTVEAVVARIASYNCKYCGTGGGHHPNCGRPR